MRSCLVLLSMIAAHAPRLVFEQAQLVLQVLSSACGPLQVRGNDNK